MGYATCRKCKGSGRFYDSKSGKTFTCRACNGSGSNHNLWTTRCQNCGEEIVYKAGNPTPRFCKKCRNIERTKTCAQSGCHNTIRYKIGWSSIPDYCGSCRKKREQGWTASLCPGIGVTPCMKVIWSPPGKHFKLCRECNDRQRQQEEAKMRTKQCATPGCTNTVRYSIDWDHPPNYCSECKKKPRSSSGYDRHKALPGSNRSIADLRVDGATVKPSRDNNNAGGLHVTVWKGRGNDAERMSWEVDSNGNYRPGTVHYTDKVMEGLLRELFGSRW